MSQIVGLQDADAPEFDSGHLDRHSLLDRAQVLHQLLVRHALSIRVSVGGASQVIGNPSTAYGTETEFRFSSAQVFCRLMADVRLYSFAKAYFDGELAIVGSLRAAMDALYAINISTDVRQSGVETARSVVFQLAKAILPFVAQRFESDAHYSVSADGYSLFLDRYFQYTCAKFNDPSETLEQGQVNKFHLIANLAETYLGKLNGLRHLDIGCGWGGLVSYFDKHFCTQSIGITNSLAQATFARNHFKVEPLLGDFDSLRKQDRKFELISIVGMAEHLTPRRRSKLFEVVSHLLPDGGVVYFQCIAKPSVWIGGDAYRVAYEDVFPGHFLETSSQMEARFRHIGFDILYEADDAADYGRTTALWAEKIERNRDELIKIIGDRNFRMFLGYLSYGSLLFDRGRGSLKRYMLRKSAKR